MNSKFKIQNSKRQRGLARVWLLMLAGTVLILVAAWLLFSLTPSTVSADDIGWQSLGRQGAAPGEFNQPRGITGFPDGSFVVVDGAARVQHFSPDNKVLHLWSMKEQDRKSVV